MTGNPAVLDAGCRSGAKSIVAMIDFCGDAGLEAFWLFGPTEKTMNQGGTAQVERLDAIRSHLYSHGFSTIQTLADVVGASLATIRRDLHILEHDGKIDRVHGGARIAEGSSVEMAFQERAKQNLDEKRAIAAAAYALLRPHAAVFLDAGTTVLQLARLIRVNPLPLHVFTNGLAVAQELINISTLDVTLIGGRLRSENASTVGPQAESTLDGLWFDQLFLGVSAIGSDGAIYSVDASEANLNKHMLDRSAQRFVLADSSKFDNMATFRVGSIADTHIVTSADISSKWRRFLSDKGVKVIVAVAGRDPGHPSSKKKAATK